jgi:predicted choloylglycine hydrolase
VLLDGKKSSTGGPLLARNLDYPSLGYIHQYSLVTVYRPKDRLAFAAVGFPGLVGVLSGMNEAGLALGVLEVFDIKIGEKHFDAKGVPYALCLRRVLEKAKSIDQAIEVLEKMRRTTCINVAIADRNDIAVLEVSPGRVIRRKPAGGLCAVTNHFRSKELKPQKPVNLDRSFERLAVLEEIRGWKRRPTVEELRKELNEVSLGTLTLQTMVFEPASGKLHLSIGKVPASEGPLRTLDLKELLQTKKGSSSSGSKTRSSSPAMR